MLLYAKTDEEAIPNN